MKRPRTALALAACCALASCATVPADPNAPATGTQAMLVQTDPPGATCSILQDGAVVAAVTATPGTAHVPRDFCRSFCWGAKYPPIEVVCRKEGYLDSRREFPLHARVIVERDETPARDVSAGEVAGGIAGAAVVGAGQSGLAAVAAAAPLIVLPILAVATAVAATRERPPAYAYRALPEFQLTPSAFGSQSECDAYFDSLKTRLETIRDATHARIAAECRFFPCKASDLVPCADSVCNQQRARADEELKTRLEQIPALRAQVRIAAP